ncbi:hypothetical protein RCL1_007190 [Eukaryota sp. TZLM3-RCL]
MYTFAIIKPDAVANNKHEEIIKVIQQNGFEVVRQTALFTMTTEQAEGFYAEHSQRPFFRDLVNFMTSGNVICMILKKENAFSEWRTLMGPTNSDVARTQNPGSIRALFGTNIERNAVHGSDSDESAKREISYWFPTFQPEAPIQHTLAMFKPDLVRSGNVDKVVEIIKKWGLQIVRQEQVQLTTERASDFYAEHKGKFFYDGLVEFMTSGPIHALILKGPNAIADWRFLMGATRKSQAMKTPQTLRALFAESDTFNAVHGSDAESSAVREINFHFPDFKF